MNSIYKNTQCRIRYASHMTQEQLLFSIELAHMIGFWQISVQFPVVCSEIEETTPYGIILDFEAEEDQGENVIAVNLKHDPKKEWQRLFERIQKLHISEEMPPKGYHPAPVKRKILTDIPSDPFLVSAGITLTDISRDTCAAACNLAARIGMEKNKLEYGLTTGEYAKKIIFSSQGSKASAHFLSPEILEISAPQEEIREFTALLCNKLPGFSVNGMTVQFQKELLNALKSRSVAPESGNFSMDLPIEDDRDTVYNLLNQYIWPKVKAGDKVILKSALWKSKAAREQLKSELIHLAKQHGATLEIEIFNTYKQGLGWLLESVLPQLLTFHNIGEIVIGYSLSDCSSWYEGNIENLPLSTTPRFLQNLYPADELLARELGIESDQIRFHPMEGNTDATFVLQAKDISGMTILERDYTVPVRVHPYIEQFPEFGTLITEAGYLIVEVNGSEFLKTMLKSDGEQVWDQYQRHILPKAMEIAAKEEYCSEKQPFFNQIVMDVTISGWEEDWKIDAEHISSGETLEDALHDAGHQMFQNFGRKIISQNLSAPGLFRPRIIYSDGKPAFHVEFQVPRTLSEWEERPLILKEIIRNDNGILPVLELDNLKKEELDIVRKHMGSLKQIMVNGVLIEKKELYTAKDAEVYFAAMKTDVVIGYEKCKEITEILREHPLFEVWEAGISYQGRSIWCIRPEYPGTGYVSRHKQYEFLPTILINGRHHANEVSATNAVFSFLQEASSWDEWEKITENVNLLFVPAENVDGVSLHEEMMQEHPTWQHRSAYTNSLGADLMQHYYNDGTIHTESKVFQDLFQDFLPDIMIDLHGVPDHEISFEYTPLGGYTGLWIPRSILCSFYFHIHEEGYESNEDFTRAWKSEISRSFDRYKEFSEISGKMEQRFQKYSYGLSDQTFSHEVNGSMLNYWVPCPYNSNHPYPSVCLPWCCTMMYTAEAADETAQGDNLLRSAKAHKIHMKAGIALTAEASAYYEVAENGETYSIKRLRPLVARNNEEEE